MKTQHAFLVSFLTATLATGGFAQGRGGGGAHGGGNPAGAASGGFGAPGNGVGRAPSTETTGRNTPHEQKPAPMGDRSAAPAAQDYKMRLNQINETAFSDRRQLLESVDMSVKSSRDALKRIQATAKASRADARDDFKAALNEVKAREKELDSALKAIRKADEVGWNASRDALAKAYQNHADALARLQTAANAAKP